MTPLQKFCAKEARNLKRTANGACWFDEELAHPISPDNA
jgi:hypothetical protein